MKTDNISLQLTNLAIAGFLIEHPRDGFQRLQEMRIKLSKDSTKNESKS